MFQIATLPSPTEVPPSPRAGGRALVLPWTSAQFVSLRMVASPGLKLNIPAFGRRPKARIPMAARVPIIRSAGLLIYLVAMAATGLLTVMLLSDLATQAIALAQPYFVDNSSCKPTRIEQRRIAVQAAASPLAERMKSKVTALVAPSIPYDVLAAQMDLAEKAEVTSPQKSTISTRISY